MKKFVIALTLLSTMSAFADLQETALSIAPGTFEIIDASGDGASLQDYIGTEVELEQAKRASKVALTGLYGGTFKCKANSCIKNVTVRGHSKTVIINVLKSDRNILEVQEKGTIHTGNDVEDYQTNFTLKRK